MGNVEAAYSSFILFIVFEKIMRIASVNGKKE